jgi:hypothetical protein
VIPSAVEEATRAAGRYLLASPVRVALDLPGDRSNLLVARAIYLAFTRDRALHYVGKIDRERGTARARISEHLRESRRKRSAWRTVWVVPIMASMPAHGLLTLERSLIRAHQPVGNVQHTRAATRIQ